MCSCTSSKIVYEDWACGLVVEYLALHVEDPGLNPNAAKTNEQKDHYENDHLNQS
jgi:hypothetical protein